jgi:ribosomal protein S28E/S33
VCNLRSAATVMLFYSATAIRRRMVVWEGREHHGEILREATGPVEAGEIMP